MSDQQDNNSQQPQQNKSPFNIRNNYIAFFILMVLIGLLSVFFISQRDGGRQEIPYSQFLEYVHQGQIESVQIIDQSSVRGVLRGRDNLTREFFTMIPYFDSTLIHILREQGVRFSGDTRRGSPLRVIGGILPWMFGFLLVWFMFRQLQGSGNRALSFGRSRAKKVEIEKQKISFADVAGQIEAKFELEEVVDFLKNPQKYLKIGARIPKGILLVGMPGTGKTLLAKACAGEAAVNFFQMSGSDFVEMFVGVGASRVRDLFEQGRKNAPCIIFIDELDAVGRIRGAGYGGGHDEREQTLNQMLVEMDGFNTQDSVIILAATNRPDVLDPALLRPGRFDRQVIVDMPDVEERMAILAIHTKKLKLDKSIDLRRIARATPGCSGADLENLANESAILAARHNRSTIKMEDIEDARDKIFMGVARKSRVLTSEEKRKTAYHESGHALLHYYCSYSDPLHKVTIVPRGQALGLAMSLPEQDIYSRGKNWILDRIKICYGGYAAEEIMFDETTTGAQNDLEQATGLARKMVTQWGMSSLGAIALGNEEEPVFLGKEIVRHTDRSDSTISKVDQEIADILTHCLDEARSILRKHKKQLIILADELIDKETLDDEQIKILLGINDNKKPSTPTKRGAQSSRKKKNS